MTTSDGMLDAALSYAGRGWPVFPLHTPVTFGPKVGPDRSYCSCRKPDCENQGKHPRTSNGLTNATTEPDTITGWWTRWPDANIGLRTGVAFDVLDIDGPDALDELDALALAELGLGDDTATDIAAVIGPMVVTGRGIHIYVAPTGAGNRAGLGGATGIDWRGRGGHAVAPPSLHYLHGDRYTWGDLYPIGTSIAAVPGWLGAIVHGRRSAPAAVGRPAGQSAPGGSRYGLRALEGELGRLATAGEGTRNDTLVRSAYRAGQLTAGGELDPVHAANELMIVAVRIGLGEGEAERTIASGMGSGIQTPRTAS